MRQRLAGAVNPVDASSQSHVDGVLAGAAAQALARPAETGSTINQAILQLRAFLVLTPDRPWTDGRRRRRTWRGERRRSARRPNTAWSAWRAPSTRRRDSNRATCWASCHCVSDVFCEGRQRLRDRVASPLPRDGLSDERVERAGNLQAPSSDAWMGVIPHGNDNQPSGTFSDEAIRVLKTMIKRP